MSDGATDDAQVPAYAGERLGFPQDGPGSVATWTRRVVALCIDWFASMLVAGLVYTGPAEVGSDLSAWVTMAVFLVEVSTLTALAGASFGQLATRIRVVRLDRAPVNLLQALLRTALICLVVPPLVFNRDQRGLHDLAVGTVTVRRA